jgi:Arc/MetJ-type ribon-helix-helix transcriptional regulator
MAKSISVKRKKRGRPATGVYPLVGVRMPPESREEIEAWAAEQDDKPSLSEAIRRLIEEALAKRKAR